MWWAGRASKNMGGRRLSSSSIESCNSACLEILWTASGGKKIVNAIQREVGRKKKKNTKMSPRNTPPKLILLHVLKPFSCLPKMFQFLSAFCTKFCQIMQTMFRQIWPVFKLMTLRLSCLSKTDILLVNGRNKPASTLYMFAWAVFPWRNPSIPNFSQENCWHWHWPTDALLSLPLCF